MGLNIAGPGAAWAVPASGATPVNFGRVSEVSLDIDLGTKGQAGGFRLPFDFMNGEAKITGKLKMAQASPLVIAALIWGVTPATGSTLTQFLEAGTITGSATYHYTVANAATFTGELEVLYAATGLPFTKVASPPSAGQYCLNSTIGELVFASADNGAGILVSYNYTSTGGFCLSMSNALQGDAPVFAVTMYNSKNGRPINYTLPLVAASKFSRQSKASAYMDPEIDIMVGANAAGLFLVENYPILA